MVERSAGVVIFRNTPKGRKYLLLHYPVMKSASGKKRGGHWDFTKGHLEKKETSLEAAQRESREETGITRLDFVSGFKETIKYFLNYKNGNKLKFVVFFLAETAQKRIKISQEHRDFVWLPFAEAMSKITFKNAKNILQKAENFLAGR